MSYHYARLYQQCRPQTSALTDNIKFLQPMVNPTVIYTRAKEEPNSPQTCKLNANGKCTNWKKDPTIWGPSLWYYLHFSAANYPDYPDDKTAREMHDWLCSLPVTIPCDNCSKHYRGYIEQNKRDLMNICKNKKKLFKFLVDIHNKVNARNGKPIMSLEDAEKMYCKTPLK